MRKINTLFNRETGGLRHVINELNDDMDWVFTSDAIPTRKLDGTSVMMLDGVLYKRQARKCKFKTFLEGYKPQESDFFAPPPDWIPAQDKPYGSQWPGWIPVHHDLPENKWYVEALINSEPECYKNGTYELVGPKIQGNPHHYDNHYLINHSSLVMDDLPALTPNTAYDVLFHFLKDFRYEGIVWHHASDDTKFAKIKRRDYGLAWPVKYFNHDADDSDM